MTGAKWEQAAEHVRACIADGTLRPGQTAPDGAALARAVGAHPLTGRKALRSLIADGTLMAGPSPNARPRVPGGDSGRDAAAHALSAALGGRRRAAGLTQAELAALVGRSLTTIGHAETGRTWQSRRFWENADKVLDAGGELLRLHDAHRAASPPSGAGRAPLADPKT